MLIQKVDTMRGLLEVALIINEQWTIVGIIILDGLSKKEKRKIVAFRALASIDETNDQINLTLQTGKVLCGVLSFLKVIRAKDVIGQLKIYEPTLEGALYESDEYVKDSSIGDAC